MASDIFIGVNALDYSGYPDCRPEYIAAFERMANLATRAGVEGRRLTIHAPLMQLTKGEIIARGLALGVDYSHDAVLLRSRCERRGVRRVRRVPASTQGLRRGGRARSGALSRTVAAHDVRREGDLLHAAGRGREHGASRGVLPFRGMQPLDGARGGSRGCDVPVLRHGLRRRRWSRRRQVRNGGCARAGGGGAVAGERVGARAKARRVHGRRAAAANG